MSIELAFLIAGYLFGFYMAWNIGANDVANSMASSVATKAITIKQAIWIAAILNMIGAIFLGGHVTNTIRSGIVSGEVLSNPHMALLGALSALLAAALWVSFATWKSLPVSTTHSIVGAMIGFGIAAGGFKVILWSKMTTIILSWVISPVFCLILSFCMFKIIVRFILKRRNTFLWALRLSPIFISITFLIIILSILFKTPLGHRLGFQTSTALLISFGTAISLGIIGRFFLKRHIKKIEKTAEDVFRYIQVITACYMSLAQGANDVANAIGPLALIYFVIKTGGVGADTVPVPWFLLVFGGFGIACGIAMAGRRVIETMGTKITALTNTRGFAVEFATATSVLVASKLGLPVSTTHAAVGGVMGVGLARGLEAVNFSIIARIVMYWLLTVPAAALTSFLVFHGLFAVFGPWL